MALRHTLAASERTLKGKEVKRLRRVGQTPGIIYGPVIPGADLHHARRARIGAHVLRLRLQSTVDVQLDDQTYVVYMRNVTMDRLKRAPQHAEFYAPNLRNPIVANVPILLVGESPTTAPSSRRACDTRDSRSARAAAVRLRDRHLRPD